MMNMQNMMKQAQKLQKQMEQSQAELAATQFVGKSAQDLVVATLTFIFHIYSPVLSSWISFVLFL